MSLLTQISPENATKVAMKCGGATFMLFEDSKGRPCANYLVGKSQKPKRFYFRSKESRAKHVSDVVANVKARKEDAARTRAERNQAHDLKEGDILCASWGYDQTNVDFFKVVKVPSACYVILQEIGYQLTEDSAGAMSGRAMPDESKNKGKETRHKVSMLSGSARVKIHSSATAYPWDGKSMYVSWYA